MKKLLLFIFIFFSFIGVSNAGREIDNLPVYPVIIHFETEIITSCDNDPLVPGTYVQTSDPEFGIITFEEIDLNAVCGENPIIIEEEINPVTDLLNDTGSGAITESGNIMNGPIGYIIYFTIGVLLITLIMGLFVLKKKGIKIF